MKKRQFKQIPKSEVEYPILSKGLFPRSRYKKIYYTSYLLVSLLLLNIKRADSQIKRIWLTHKSNEPSHIVINWESKQAGDAEVFFGGSSNYEYRVKKSENVILHHVEIPLRKKDIICHYMVKSGNERSADHTFKAYPTDELRVAIVGNWGNADHPDLSHLIADRPHLLLTCGDNIPNLHEICGIGKKGCIEPYLKLVDSAPEVFNSIPFMPILGNHDKEIRDRGEMPPKEKVYDIDATAYKKFVELPGKEWEWVFKIPDFNVTFIALDLNHISDLGTTYQSSHDYRVMGEQFKWYRNLMEGNQKGFVITLDNEQNSQMRNVEHGAWCKLFQKGTAVVTGFGNYSERAEVDEFPYFNTSLKFGDLYPDPYSRILRGINGYILLTFTKRNVLVVELKSLDGKVIDRSEWLAR